MANHKDSLVCLHEEQIHNQSRKIERLEARADFKDKRIDKIMEDQKAMEDKIDKLIEAVNNLHFESLEDDKDIDKRVTRLESTVNVLKWITTLLFGSGLVWIIMNFIGR